MNVRLTVAVLFLASLASNASAQSYLGFDRNDYPGDDGLKTLRQTFSYAGFWLNNPPGEKSNNWNGKRKKMEDAGFGFLVLFNGRLYADLKSVSRATAVGKSDGRDAIAAARKEGFPAKTIIFLDQEQGGRLLPEQKAYLFAWIDAVAAAGFGTGVYCSGIPAAEGGGKTIITANDIRQNAGRRRIAYWVTNDACPPSPGCTFPKQPPQPKLSGIDFADVWQFAQSPKRNDVASGCPANYNADGECYPLGVNPAQHLHVDVDTASSHDPSHGRTY